MASGLLKDPVTGLNKFQAAQQAAQGRPVNVSSFGTPSSTPVTGGVGGVLGASQQATGTAKPVSVASFGTPTPVSINTTPTPVKAPAMGQGVGGAISAYNTAKQQFGGATPTTGSVTGGQQGVSGQSDIDPQTGLPTWIGASEQDAINQQLAALQGQSDAAKQTEQAGIDANNAYLMEQLQGLQSAQAVDNQGAQELQNRRGGFYSGGLDYQLGNIGSAYAQQRGSLSRDIASRNQQLIDQYGTQANTIAAQIKDLQTSAPEIIKQKINDYLTTQATLTGNYLGGRTLTGQTQDQNIKDANINAALQVGQQFGVNVSPQSDYSGLFRQVASGVDSNGNPLTQTQAAKQYSEQQAYQVARDSIADTQWQAKFDQDVKQSGLDYALNQLQEQNQTAYQNAQLALSQDDNARQWASLDYSQQQASNQGTGEYKGLSPEKILDAIKSNYTVQDPSTKKNRITADPALREQMFLEVIDSTAGMSDAQVTQLLRTLGLTSKEITQFSQDNAGK